MTLDLRGINYKLTADTQSGVVGINAATEALKRADAAAVRTSGAFLQFGKQGELTARQMQALNYQTTDIITSLASGQSPFLVLLQQGGQLRDQFGSLPNVFRAVAASVSPAALAVGALAAAAGGLGLLLFEGSEESRAFAKGLALSGNAAGLTEGAVNSMARSVADLSGNTLGRAREAITKLALSNTFTAESMANVGRAALVMQRLTGESIDEITRRFAGARDGVARWAVENNRAYNFVNAAQVQHLRTLEAQGKVQEAANAMFGQLADTLTERSAPALGMIDRLLQSVANKWSALINAPRTFGATESFADELKSIEDNLKHYAARPSGRPGEDAAIRAELERQRDDVLRRMRATEEQQRGAEESAKLLERTSKAGAESILRVEQATFARRAAESQAFYDRIQAQTERAYGRLEIDAQEYRDTIESLAESRLASEEAAARKGLEFERRRAATAEKPAEKRAGYAAILDAETKLFQVQAKRALELEKIRNHELAIKEIVRGESAQAAFRRAELTAQRGYEEGFAPRNLAASQAFADLLRANREMNAEMIIDDRARGLAIIANQADEMKRRLEVLANYADEAKSIDDALAEWRVQRERQLAKQLQPEWKRRYEEQLGNSPKAIEANFNDAMSSLERSGASAWATLTRGGKGAAQQLRDAFNAEFARIGWNQFLARPFFDVLERMFSALGMTGAGAFGSAASPYGTGLGVRLGHSGGIVGAGMGGGAMRSANPLVFAGAGRYHRGGLVGNEVPAILQRGEEVITRGDSRHRLNGGGQAIQFGPFNFNVPAGISPAAYAVAVQPALDALQAKIVSDLARPGTTAHAAARR